MPPTLPGPMAALRGMGDEGFPIDILTRVANLWWCLRVRTKPTCTSLWKYLPRKSARASVCRAPPPARVLLSTHARAQGTGTSRWPQKRASGDSHSRIGKAGGSAVRGPTTRNA